MIKYNEVISHLRLCGARDHSTYEKMRKTWIDPNEAIPDEITCQNIWNEIKVDFYKANALKRLHRRSLSTLHSSYRSQDFDYKVENALSGVYELAICEEILRKHRDAVNEFRRCYYEQKDKIDKANTITQVNDILKNTRFPKLNISEEQ